VHGLSRSSEFGLNLHDRHLRFHLQDRLHAVWRCVYCSQRVLHRCRLPASGGNLRDGDHFTHLFGGQLQQQQLHRCSHRHPLRRDL
jgi:hypothetical protein